MSVLDDPRVTIGGGFSGYTVQISHGRYLVEEDDRSQPPLWWAHDDAGLRVAAVGSTDPLTCSSDVCSGWETPDDLIAALLAFDGEAVPA